MRRGFAQFFGTFVSATIIGVVATAAPGFLAAQPIAGAGTELVDLIRANTHYRELLDEDALELSVLRGIVDALNDPYAVVVDTRTAGPAGPDGAYTEDAAGAESTDLGIVLSSDRYGRIIVQSVLPGSPAARADLRSGERMLRAGGVNLAGLSVWETMPLFSVPAGTEVALVREAPDGAIRRSVLTAEAWEARTVELRIGNAVFEGWRDDPAGPVAWLRVHAFLDSTPEEWNAAIARIHGAPGVRRIVLDLRDNGGGSNACIPLIGDFLMGGDAIVRFERLLGDRGASEVVRNLRAPRSRLIAYPAVVLVNGRTASLAEIAALALRDNRAVPVVGEATYGKGTTQTWVRVGDHYAVHLTVGRWFGPSGTSVDGVGIAPDRVIADDERTRYTDEQLAGAVRFLMAR